jgi:hypothetical protein
MKAAFGKVWRLEEAGSEVVLLVEPSTINTIQERGKNLKSLGIRESLIHFLFVPLIGCCVILICLTSFSRLPEPADSCIFQEGSCHASKCYHIQVCFYCFVYLLTNMFVCCNKHLVTLSLDRLEAQI